jgi:hypothetical protein
MIAHKQWFPAKLLCEVTYFNESTYFTTFFICFCYIIMYIFYMIILHKTPSSSHHCVPE